MKKKQVTLGLVLPMAAITAVLLFLVLRTHADNIALIAEISDCDKQIKTMKYDIAKFRLEIESNLDLKSIEEYAQQNQLKKLNNTQIEYITVEDEYIIVIPEDTRNFWEKLLDWFIRLSA